MIRLFLTVFIGGPVGVSLGIIGCFLFLFLFPFRKIKNDVFHAMSKLWGTFMFFLSGAKLHVEGGEHLKRDEPCIIMANHQSAYDIFLFFKVLPGQFRWISKDAYFKIPLGGFAMRQAGYISIKRERKRSAYESILKAGRHLREGRSVVIFPEGTRSVDGQMRRFKPGIFLLSEQHPDVPILPIVMHGTLDIMRKGERAIHPAKVCVRVLAPVHRSALEGEDKLTKLKSLEYHMKTEHRRLCAEHFSVSDSVH